MNHQEFSNNIKELAFVSGTLMALKHRVSDDFIIDAIEEARLKLEAVMDALTLDRFDESLPSGGDCTEAGAEPA